MGSWVRIGDSVKTKDEIDARARRVASGYASLGVGSGDVVAVYMRNSFDFIEASLGAGLCGAYVVPVNWHNTAEEARYVLEDSGAKVLAIHADLWRSLRDIIPPSTVVIVAETPHNLRAPYRISGVTGGVPPDAIAWEIWLASFKPAMPPFPTSPGSMIYTSGTTGHPKGVRRQPPTPEQALASQQMMRSVGGLTGWAGRLDEAILLIPGPAYHSSPNGWLFSFYNMGTNLIVEPRFEPERMLETIHKHRVTHALVVPTMFVRLLALPAEIRKHYDTSSLTHVMHVGAPCPQHIKHAMIAWWGPVITEHYGSTEVGAVTYCTADEWLAHPGTVGRPLEGCQVVVMDEAGHVLASRQAGEVVCGRDVYPEFTYHRAFDKREKSARGSLVATGDVGYFDEEGFLYLSGRASDMIIFGGTNVYPAEIESELMKIPGVADCAVFGIPDEEFGEKACAFIQTDVGAKLDERDIRDDLKSRLAGYKIPSRIEFSDALPREDTGKIFKRKLKEPFWQGVGRSI